jgi:hypothetical protein
MGCPSCKRTTRLTKAGTIKRAGLYFASNKSVSSTNAPNDTGEINITDQVLFIWSRIPRIARLIPSINAVRELEVKLRTVHCGSCRKKNEPIDKSSLNTVREFLATCSDETAELVKEAAGIVKYRLTYSQPLGQPTEVVR